MAHEPRLGIQGPVVGWPDPWAGEASEQIMRTGTGSPVPSQDPRPEPAAFLKALSDLGADFYVHHVIPEAENVQQVMSDAAEAGLDVCLGNEYGNINGPWAEGTNRYDLTDTATVQAAGSGRCIGLLYDEPEHLQINAAQYRKDGWYPHWGSVDGLSLEASRRRVGDAVSDRRLHVERLLEQAGKAEAPMPLISEHVFPVMYHTFARAGMDLCPKIMKESFQSLQLATALGAAKQYGRSLWICADLWGPDAGEWFTRYPGFPGHSPEEFESALKLGYLMGPSHLFVENVDVLLRHTPQGFRKTEYGEVWEQFTRSFVPAHPLSWNHSQAEADIAVIASDDANYGQNERVFGSRTLESGEAQKSVFHIWHLLSRGTIPSHGSCMHIPGYEFPRHELKRTVAPEAFPLENGRTAAGFPVHGLFYPARSVLVFDDEVTRETLGKPGLILTGGTSLSERTFRALVTRAEEGGVVVIAKWLIPEGCPQELTVSGRRGAGQWIVTDHFLEEQVKEAAEPFLGEPGCWTQRFGTSEVRIAAMNKEGTRLAFDIASK
ncbi:MULTISPECIES: hypothetical protein [Paenibacillus]|uniref:hypothetical protein n=1 Tax=Paenibacillus TaxID=44249 RepID=UPI0022B867C8|nr:hypothetical protein [Paenibacillus caseinilyticus]MCZ8519526.1 hypothetical protein [Paenibacillus caseinilyticus]